MATNRNVLYRIYGEDGTLLYVGASTNLSARLETHGRLQPWWDEATDIKLQRFSTWEELSDAEALAITEESPKYNLIHSKPSVWSQKPRQPRGEGSLFFRSSDQLWIGRVELPPGVDGKRRQKTVASKDRRTAQKKLNALKAQFQS